MNKNLRWPNNPEVKVTSLKSLLVWLKPLFSAVETKDEIAAAEYIINEIGKCANCRGTGEIINEFAPNNTGYKVKFFPRGKKRFLTVCGACKGQGHILEIECVSCGVKADRQPAQRHIQYCNDCEMKLTATGTLI